jgi:hypothetical protein
MNILSILKTDNDILNINLDREQLNEFRIFIKNKEIDSF